MSYTPGPWKVFRSGFDGDRPGIEATSVPFSVITFGDSDVDDDAGVKGRTPEEMEANACLIAAAPDLLEACKLWAKHLESHGQIKQELADFIAAKESLKSAIAKAEGKS
jgi:hypothetical protein